MSGRPRSFLFVPGDSERKQAKALAGAADALILDLEDSVTAAALPQARQQVAELLRAHTDRSARSLWVRVNPLSSGALLDDLVAVFPGAPDGIVLPKIDHPEQICQAAHYLGALEAQAGRKQGSTRLIVIATESPRAVLTFGEYPRVMDAHPHARERLAGLTWGSEDLSSAMAITHKSDRHGSLTFPFRLARSLCVVAAAAVGVQAIDGVFLDFRDREGLRRDVESARRDGFTAKLAIHPEQVELINEAFLPTAEEIEWAKRVVRAFAGSPGAGVVGLDGQMVDRPHLVQAHRLLDRAGLDATALERPPG